MGLLALLGIIVGFQLITWIYANLSDDLDKKAKTLQVSSADLRSKCDLLSPKTLDKDGKPHEWTHEETASFDSIAHKELDLNIESIRLYETSRFLAVFLPGLGASQGQLEIADTSKGGDWVVKCNAHQ